MKRTIFIAIAIAFLMCGCSSRIYEDGYKKGYNDAILELEAEYEWNLDERYLDGYSDGYGKIADSRSDAEYYASDRSLYHPEDARMIIDAYDNNEPFWSNGEPPSQEDFMDAVRSLYYFYEYYYNGVFSNYRDP